MCDIWEDYSDLYFPSELEMLTEVDDNKQETVLENVRDANAADIGNAEAVPVADTNANDVIKNDVDKFADTLKDASGTNLPQAQAADASAAGLAAPAAALATVLAAAAYTIDANVDAAPSVDVDKFADTLKDASGSNLPQAQAADASAAGLAAPAAALATVLAAASATTATATASAAAPAAAVEKKPKWFSSNKFKAFLMFLPVAICAAGVYLQFFTAAKNKDLKDVVIYPATTK